MKDNLSNAIELALHAVGGAAMALVEMAVTGNVWLSFLWPTLLGFTRESEQARVSRGALSAMLGRRIRPSDVRHWSPHRLAEWAAWPIGAGVAVVLWSMR